MRSEITRDMADAPDCIVQDTEIPLVRPLKPVYAEAFDQLLVQQLRRMATDALEDELNYLRREYAEATQLQAIQRQAIALEDWLAPIVARGRAIKEELERRRRFAVPSSGPRRPQLVDFAHELKQRLDLPGYLVHLGMTPDLKRLGHQYRACCPFHTEKTPSFYVWEEPDPHWHCFGCGAGSDVYDALQLRGDAHSWVEAVKLVAEYLRVSLPMRVARPDFLVQVPDRVCV